MTNLNSVNMGFNKYCGPSVLSILTGKSTDECANVISSINGHHEVVGVKLNDLLGAAERLGFDWEVKPAGHSLYTTLVTQSREDGMYIVTLPDHFVCIEVKEGKIYFCDNHTREPIPAASSARLTQKVIAIHKVTKRPEPPKPVQISSKIYTEASRKYPEIHLIVKKKIKFNISAYNTEEVLGTLYFLSEDEYNEFCELIIRRFHVDNSKTAQEIADDWKMREA